MQYHNLPAGFLESLRGPPPEAVLSRDSEGAGPSMQYHNLRAGFLESLRGPPPEAVLSRDRDWRFGQRGLPTFCQ
jgi:hypothetical protein